MQWPDLFFDIMKRFDAFILILLLAVGCEQPTDVVRGYPQFASSEITSITTGGITIEATAVAGTTAIATDHGFVWSESAIQTLADSYSLSLGKPTSDSFKADIRAQLLVNKKYSIRPYLKTSAGVIYGPVQQFTSLGSEGPIIESFAPKIVVPKDIITIKGIRFGAVAKNVTVSFKGEFASYKATVKTVNDTELIVEVPAFVEPKATIEILVIGNQLVTSAEQIIRKLPTLLSIKSTGACERIEITGENLTSMGNIEDITLNNRGGYLSVATVSDNLITLPADLHTNGQVEIAVVVTESTSGQILTASKRFSDSFPKPTFETGAIPATAKAGDIITIRGTNFPTCDGIEIVATTGTPYLVESVTSTELKVKIHETPCSAFKLRYFFRGVQYALPEHDIGVTSAIVDTYTDHAGPGQFITVTGDGLEGLAVFIVTFQSSWPDYAGRLSFTEISNNGRQAVFMVPVPDLNYFNIGANNEVPFVIKKCEFSNVYPFVLDIAEPVITSFSPTLINGHETFTINGVNFLDDPNLSVYLQDENGNRYPCSHTINSANEITATPHPGAFLPDGQYHVAIIKYSRGYGSSTTMTIDRP
jgi:hypothetical protein